MKDTYEPLELDLVKEQVARHASFSLGKQLIRQMTPRFDALWVKRELTRVKEAYALVVRFGNMPFGGIHDTKDSIEAAMKDMTLTPSELREIADSTRAVEQMRKYMKASDLETPLIRELTDSFAQHQQLAASVEHCISMNSEVLDNASAKLKSIRKSILSCNGDISSEVQRFISRNANKLMDTITTVRNERTCVLVKISEKNSVDGFVHGESASGQTAYVEPRSLLVLNNRLQALKSQEQEEITRILFELSQQVKAVGHELLGNLETFALLDSIFARGLWTKAQDGCIAELNTRDDHLFLKAARHPLIDPQRVVANTYEIRKPHHSLLITGSNTGGKTVTLKTIGLFVALTMSGMPLSAEEAVVPLFDALYVDIGDDQSIQESLSTFSSHISKLADICDHASARSLVLLDELGSGTDPKEGEPLAVAVLDHLRAIGAMVIATTHYSALKTYGADNEDILLSSVEFDMELMKPTYRYIEGISGQSNAFEIARRYGLKDSIIQFAKSRKEADRSRADIAMEKLEQSLMENHELKEKLNARLQDVKQLQEDLEREKKQLENRRKEILETVKEDARKQLEASLEEAQDIIEELKQMQSDAKPHEISDRKAKLNKLSQLEDEAGQSEHTERKKTSYQVGDYVKISKLSYYGEIVSMNKEKVCVLANGMKMNTTIHDIEPAVRQVQKTKKKGYSKASVRAFSMECNVIGMRVAEALPIIDKYLDNAMLAKANNVRIIHGMGTGALRKGVHDFLKRNPRVESFHMGGQGEGGLGATVVSLKQKGSAK
ncbi:endonuclease MutS2 [[Clostridium] innocuum]|nr:endonuclease MutS2 [[Clostridium] innocuum]